MTKTNILYLLLLTLVLSGI